MLISSGDNYDYLCSIEHISDDVVTAKIIETREKMNELPVKVYLFRDFQRQTRWNL